MKKEKLNYYYYFFCFCLIRCYMYVDIKKKFVCNRNCVWYVG